MRMMVALLAKPFLDGIAPFQFSAGTLCGLIGVFWRLVISSMSIAFATPLPRPGVLWNLLRDLSNAPDSWIGSLRTSLAWLVQRCGALPNCPHLRPTWRSGGP